MSIKVNTYQLQSKSIYAASIASQLKEKADQLNSIYYSLDSKVRNRQVIGSSMRSLQNRIDNAQRKMYNISSFLTRAADKYNITEAGVVARAASLGSATSINAGISAVGAVNVGASTGAAQGKVEGKKWYQSNWFKIAVGAVVVGAAVAFAVIVGGPILLGMAVGAAIGAGVGAVTGGVVSKMNGGNFWDGAADGFMWGAIGGAASGAIGATGVGMLGAAGVEGTINAGVYVGQTLQNGGDVSVAGVATSFIVGAGFSAIGTVAANKISRIASKNVSNSVDDIAKGMREAGGLRQSALKELTPGEINYIKNEFTDIGGDPSKLRFNKGGSTSYRDDIDAINIRGDIFPAVDEIHPRSVMSERAVLAHEFYGHGAYRNTTVRPGSWNDEFRASFMAALNAPNLSDIDRYHLIQDAICRAQEAGVSIKPNEFMRRILYGY